MSDESKPPEPPHQSESDVDAASGPKEDAASLAAPARRRGRTVGIVLAVVLGALAVLCVGGVGAGFFFYRSVSEPDRSTPAVVVRQYLQATFDDRDKVKAARFTCGNPTEISAVERTLGEIVDREERFGIRITVDWENFVATERNDAATVMVRLKIQVPEETGQSSESFQDWSFALRRQSNGWRVCGGQQKG